MSTDPVCAPFAVSVETARREARRLEDENPLWIVVFGIYSKEFVCFPRFRVRSGAIVVARYPGAAASRMRRIEDSTRDAVTTLPA